jgi:hypothetical protein
LVCVTVGCATYRQPPPPPVVIATTTLTASGATTQVTTKPMFDVTIDAFPMPPIGWQLSLVDEKQTHKHLVWTSPTTHTAYGVLFFQMPFPVGHELALTRGLLPRMQSEAGGQLTLLSKMWDDKIEGIRFDVEVGQYRTRATLFVRGMQGWMVYAGTIRKQPTVDAELREAEQAREMTVVNPKRE